MRLGSLLVGVSLLSAVIAWGQTDDNATAALRTVVTVDRPATSSFETPVRRCVDRGTYIFAFQPDGDGATGGASVLDFGTNPYLGQSTDLIADDQKLVWKTLNFNLPTCFDIYVMNGRARIYELIVTVEWPAPPS